MSMIKSASIIAVASANPSPIWRGNVTESGTTCHSVLSKMIHKYPDMAITYSDIFLSRGGTCSYEHSNDDLYADCADGWNYVTVVPRLSTKCVNALVQPTDTCWDIANKQQKADGHNVNASDMYLMYGGEVYLNWCQWPKTQNTRFSKALGTDIAKFEIHYCYDLKPQSSITCVTVPVQRLDTCWDIANKQQKLDGRNVEASDMHLTYSGEEYLNWCQWSETQNATFSTAQVDVSKFEINYCYEQKLDASSTTAPLLI